MAALPYMPLYVADYMADAAHLTTMQHGAYLLLIMNYWQRGEPLPNDDARLARIARMSTREWQRNRDVLAEFFATAGTNWVHQRIDSELARVEAKSLKSKKAAQASVQQRFGGRSADAKRALNHTDTDTYTEESSDELSSARGLWSKPPIGATVDKQVWSDFLKNRKRKNLPNTDTAFKRLLDDLQRVSEKTGMSAPQLIIHAAGKGWGAIYNPNERQGGTNGAGNGTGRTAAAASAAFGDPGGWTDDRPL